MLNIPLINKRINEQRKKGVPETEIQRRISEIQNGIDAADYQLPDPPSMANGTSAIKDTQPQPTIVPPDYKAIRLQQAADLKADDANGGKGKDRIIAYYNSFLPSQTEKDAATISTADQKRLDASRSMTNLVGSLEDKAQKAGIGDYSYGPLNRVAGVAKNIGGAVGLNSSAKTYNDQREGFMAALKGLTGDVGILTNQDYERIVKLIPDMGATPEETIQKFNDLRSQLAATFGGKAEKTKVKTPGKNVAQAGLDAANALVPNIMAVPDKINKRVAEGKNVLETQGPDAMAKWIKEKTPSVGISGGISDLITNKGYAREDLPVGLEAAGLASGGLLLKSGASAIGKVKDIPRILTGVGLNKAREEAAKGLTVNTQPLIDAGEDYVKTINPSATKSWEVLKPALKETTDVNKLLKIIIDWGDKAYTNSGDVRAIAEGQLKNHLYQTARNILKTEAPDVAEITTAMAKGMRNKKILGAAGKLAGQAAITGTTFALLNKLMGSGHNNQ